jgi:hypothetical protein
VCVILYAFTVYFSKGMGRIESCCSVDIDLHFHRWKCCADWWWSELYDKVTVLMSLSKHLTYHSLKDKLTTTVACLESSGPLTGFPVFSFSVHAGLLCPGSIPLPAVSLESGVPHLLPLLLAHLWQPHLRPLLPAAQPLTTVRVAWGLVLSAPGRFRRGLIHLVL